MIHRNDVDADYRMLQGMPDGMYLLPHDRLVWWTRRVAIGARAERRPPRDIGTHAEALQAALLSEPGFRSASRPRRARLAGADWLEIGHRLVPWVCLGCLCLLVARLIIERCAS